MIPFLLFRISSAAAPAATHLLLAGTVYIRRNLSASVATAPAIVSSVTVRRALADDVDVLPKDPTS